MTNTNNYYYLQTMGIDVWISRDRDPVIKQTDPWQQLQRCVKSCQACDLHKTRTQTVFGVGTLSTDLLIVGEAPGQQEDLKGEPFVGRAGKLLDNMLFAIGLDRRQIYIANVLKCRPPKNRDPSPQEVATCTPFLNQQIEILRPKLILAVGRIAAQYLLNSTLSLTRLRNQEHIYQPTKTPLLVTFHPAFLLRSPKEKGKAYLDLLRAKELLLHPL